MIDGTYELFRHFYAMPSRTDREGNEVAALLGVTSSIASMIQSGATHIGVATDHVIESFRNSMYPSYKSGEGIDPKLWRQFHPLEDLLSAMGVAVWPMVDQEADDGLAAGAHLAEQSPSVTRVLICTPDKDLAQCVRGERVVQFDRRRQIIRNEEGIREKFGVVPESIPDYLALVGDSADGYPGIPKWGGKSAATALKRYGHLEKIPRNPLQWDCDVRGSESLAASLADHWEEALLFRDIATLKTDAALFGDLEDLRWRGPRAVFRGMCEELNAANLADQVARLVAS